jgi:nucleotide-binding universal stress UspA family protein
MSAPHPFQRLLLATEHTDFDSGAEALALALAQRCGLPLAVVLPMLSNPEFEMLAPALAQKADAQVAAHIQALHAAAQPLGVELQPRVRRGSDLADEIVDEARRAQADLLVIRRRGQRSFLSRLLVGEMVSRVVARSPCSVLVAPRAAVMWRTGVMVGVHPQAPDAAVVAAAASVAAACQVPLRLACVAESDGDQPLARAAIDSLMQSARANAQQQVAARAWAVPHRPLRARPAVRCWCTWLRGLPEGACINAEALASACRCPLFGQGRQHPQSDVSAATEPPSPAR